MVASNPAVASAPSEQFAIMLQGQVFNSTPVDSDSTLGNGYDNGEDDEASLSVRVR